MPTKTVSLRELSALSGRRFTSLRALLLQESAANPDLLPADKWKTAVLDFQRKPRLEYVMPVKAALAFLLLAGVKLSPDSLKQFLAMLEEGQTWTS